MKQVHIISYPRSGNTWLRFLLVNLLYPEKDVNYVSLNFLSADRCQQSEWKRLGIKDTRITKHHECFLPEYKKVIYLYRDGRDVALSLYHYNYKNMHGLSFPQFLNGIFIPGRLQYGNWKEHLEFWLFKNHNISFIPIQYENMLVNLSAELEKIIDFCEIEATPIEIQTAINKSSYENLLKTRAKNKMHPNIMGLRGTSGRWREVFSDRDTKLFWAYAKDLMTKLGYGRGT